ncbi:MAG: S8 family serine peptidase, partial [Desulfobacterales bacterium]|nr:S8 family serine peptidase [Desulfobacterales bacterium]
AWNKGSILTGAAGNDNTNDPHYPSAYETVISVAATNRKDKKASYSNYGDTIELAAPGGDRGNYRKEYILSTYIDNSYAYAYGTSMATPHVSGLAALVWSYIIPPSQTKSYENTSATPLTTSATLAGIRNTVMGESTPIGH